MLARSYSEFESWHIDKLRKLNVYLCGQNDYMEFPIFWDRSCPLVEHLYYIFQAYLDELIESKTYELGNEGYLEIVKICNLILKIIKDEMKGISSCYQDEDLKPIIKTILSFPKISFAPMSECENNDSSSSNNKKTEVSLFRARGQKELFERSAFYHVPFNKPYLCTSYRFSAAGYPCLYLGYSEEVCYAEIGGKKGSIVEFKAKECDAVSENSDNNLTLLDLTIHEAINDPKLKNENYTFFKLWPILAACYVAVPKELDEELKPNYKEEYIFPQWITRIIANGEYEDKDVNRIRGIRYYSCRKKDLITSQTTYMNVAIFPKDERKQKNVPDASPEGLMKPYEFDYEPYDIETIDNFFIVKAPHNS